MLRIGRRNLGLLLGTAVAAEPPEGEAREGGCQDGDDGDDGDECGFA